MLTSQLASEIVRETMHRSSYNVNMMNESGIIIASGDPNRIGHFHEGAFEAIRQNRELSIRAADAARWKGVLPGVNVPICYQGETIGAVGVSGDPDLVMPVAQLVRMAAELMLRRQHERLEQDWRQLSSAIVLQLAQESVLDIQALTDRLAALALKPEPPYQGIIVQLGSHAIRNPGHMQRFADIVQRASIGNAVGSLTRPGVWMALLLNVKPERTQLLASRLEEMLRYESLTASIGIGEPAERLEDVPRCFREAELAVRLNAGSGLIHRYRDVQAEAAVYELPEHVKARYWERFRPIWNPKIQQTLECYFRHNQHISAAADELGIHRNTLVYRLEHIHKVTGCSPQQFHDAVLLQTVVWLFRFEKEE